MEGFDLKAAVQRGATWLDEAMPGWHDRIDLDTLEMRSSTMCVGGQGIPAATYTSRGFSNGYAWVNAASPYPPETSRAWRRDVWNGFTHPDVIFSDTGTAMAEMYPEGDAVTLAGIEPDPRIVELKALWVDEITARRLSDALSV
jgi:hypothetical protein